MPHLSPTFPSHIQGRIFPYLVRHQPWVLAVSALIATVQALAMAALPHLLGKLLDHAADWGPALWRYLALFVVVGALNALLLGTNHYFITMLWVSTFSQLNGIITTRTTRLGHALTDRIPSGDIISTAVSDSERFSIFLEQLPRYIRSLLLYIFASVMVLSQSVRLGLLILIGLPLVSAISAVISRPLQRRNETARASRGHLATVATDTVTGLRILRGVGGENYFTHLYRRQSRQVRADALRVENVRAIITGVQAFFPGLFSLLLIWAGVVEIYHGHLTAGQVTAFYSYSVLLAVPITDIFDLFMRLAETRASAKKITTLLEVEPAAGHLTENHNVPHVPAPHPGTPILAFAPGGVQIQAGEFTAIVACDPDDAAHLARILARFDDAASAPVTYAGQPITSLPLAQVRSRVVFASAHPDIFEGTIRTNVDPDGILSDAEIWQALRTADAADVVSSAGGLDGHVAERGRSLSGGQRQRLALARALARANEVLIAVEPTSAVDSHTETRIAAAIAEARRGRTTVIVTESPLVLEHADTVLFYSEGMVSAQGTHRELLSRAATDPVAARYAQVVAHAKGDE